MHSSREAFSSLQTQQGWLEREVGVSLGVEMGMGEGGSESGIGRTLTAAEAEPEGLRSEDMFAAVDGAGRGGEALAGGVWGRG